MQIDWSPLHQELAQWRAARLDLPIWWRDDDAVAQTPALDRLEASAAVLQIPVHLAVIPALVDESLVAFCHSSDWLVPLVHGWRHQNHAPVGAKKAEFGHPRPGLAEEAARGLHTLETAFGPALLPLFVPPWNRIDAGFVADLRGLGFAGLSTFKARRARDAAPGLVQINTHIDPIDWAAGGGLRPPGDVVAGVVQILQDRRRGQSDTNEPLGVLTHHLVHDRALWSFTEALLGTLLEGGARPVRIQDYL